MARKSSWLVWHIKSRKNQVCWGHDPLAPGSVTVIHVKFKVRVLSIVNGKSPENKDGQVCLELTFIFSPQLLSAT